MVVFALFGFVLLCWSVGGEGSNQQGSSSEAAAVCRRHQHTRSSHRQRHRLRRFQPNNQHASYRTYPTAIAMSSTSPPSSTGAATTSHVQNSPQQRKRNLPTRTPVGKAGFEVWVLIKGTCRHFRAGPGFGSGCVLPPSTVPPPTGGPGQGSCQGCVCLCGAKVWSGQRRSKFGSVTLRTD